MMGQWRMTQTMMGQWWVRSQDWVDVHMLDPLVTLLPHFRILKMELLGGE